MMANEQKELRDKAVALLSDAEALIEDMNQGEGCTRLAGLMAAAAQYALLPDDADYGRLFPELVGDVLHELWAVREEVVLAGIE